MQRKLKKIELFGFKSFAERTVLEFSPGITAVVGPNGCGKSNISDAVRWVLGEQSAKSMRGMKMEDLIFAGTAKRRPLNLAEVIITFCNEDGSFPVEFSEVSITRRVHRNGESEYLINRRPARLKDIHNLLFGSGVGRNAFSTFEQGKMDQIIYLSPEERRGIFEEAAGITRFLTQKSDATRKLKHTEQNLERVLDIYEEVEKQVALTEKQAAQANEFKKKKQEIELLEKGVLAARWERFHEQWRSAQQKEAQCGEKLRRGSADFERWRNRLQEEKKQLANSEEALKEKQKDLYRLQNLRDVKSGEEKSFTLRYREYVEREKQLEREKGNLEEKLVGLTGALERGEMEVGALEKRISDAEEELRKHREHTQNLESEAARRRREQAGHHQDRLHLIQEENQAESRLSRMRIRLDYLEEKRDRIIEERQKVAASLAQTEASFKNHGEALERITEEIGECRARLGVLTTVAEELQQEISVMRDAGEKLQERIVGWKAREKALLRLRDDMEGFSKAAKHLLAQSESASSPLFGKIRPLYQIFSIQEDDWAAACSIRMYAQTLAVGTADDLRQAAAYAAEKQLSDYSVVSLEAAGNPSDGLLSHFTRNLRIVDNLEEALREKAPSGCFWSRDGAFVDSNGVVFYPGFGESNAFVREAELKNLRKQIEAAEKKLEEVRFAKSCSEEIREEKQRACQEEEKALRKGEMRLVEVNALLRRAKEDLEKLTKDEKKAEQDRMVLQQESEQIRSGISDAEDALCLVRENAESALRQYSTAEAELERSLVVLKNQQHQQQIQEGAYRALLEQQRKAAYDVNLSKIRKEEGCGQREKINAEITRLRQSQKEIQASAEECRKALEAAGKDVSGVAEALAAAQEASKESREKVEGIEKEGEGLRELVHQVEKRLYEAEVEKRESASSKDRIESELLERFNISLGTLRESEEVLDMDLETAEKKVKTLRRQLQATGDVNLSAIEEWKQHAERHRFLTEQLEDLRQAKNHLAEIIENLDAESRKLFVETFEQVRENFRKNFSILFNGGEADLRCIDQGDVLMSGVDIIAKPPGKQMRSISLLSGGEKCMTALALLFAIFEVRPAPFSILDEIDAPLDDSNVDRFVNVVKQFTDRCQFIVVTHNKRTMSIADRIYGVSMEEQGVSKMLSMEFEREEVVVPI